MTEPAFGTSRPIEELTLDDILRHPIWVWALDEETLEGQDETWVKPVTNMDNAGEDLAYFFPLLTFRVMGSQLHGSGDYDHDGFTTGDGVPLDLRFSDLAGRRLANIAGSRRAVRSGGLRGGAADPRP